MTRPDYTGN